MKAFNYIPLYTYEDYRQWEGDWEIIHGHPHAMSPSPKRTHQLFNGEIAFSLKTHLKQLNGACGECEVYQDLDWIVDDGTVVRPDVMIVCGEFKDDFLRFPPSLVVEILSSSTALKDRNIKYRLYESQGVRYYILVEPDLHTCEIMELRDGVYVQNHDLRSFTLDTGCALEWDIPALLADLKG